MPTTQGPVPVRTREASREVEALLRQIITLVEGVSPGHAWDRDEHDEAIVTVMCDVHIDGVSYQVLRLPPESLSAGQPAVVLSPREREIVRLVAKGLPNKSIADVLDISLWTVATHLRRVFAKLGVSTRTEMVAHLLSSSQWEEPLRSLPDAANRR